METHHFTFLNYLMSVYSFLLSKGKMKSPMTAESIVPNTIAVPKRCVGGNEEKKKIEKPEHIMNIDVTIGFHMTLFT